MVAVFSGAWLRVNQFYYRYRKLQPRDSNLDPIRPCWLHRYQWAHTSTVGIWGMCFTMNNFEERIPVCVNFLDDVLPAPWLTLVQTSIVLSPTLSALGLVCLGVDKLRRWNENSSPAWLASKLFTLSGVCSVGSCLAYSHVMRPEFLTITDPRFVVLNRDWSMYVYVYGCLMYVSASLCATAPGSRSSGQNTRRHKGDKYI